MSRFLAIVVLTTLGNAASAEDYTEWVGANGGVNWTSGEVRAEGAGLAPEGRPASVGALLACRAAIVDAQRNLLESMQGVRVEGTTLVENMMLESDVIRTTVSGVLKGAQIIERAPSEDGTCRVTMSAPLSGQLAAKIYDDVLVDAGDAASTDDVFHPANWIAFALGLLISEAEAAEPDDWRGAFDDLSRRIDALETLLTTQPRAAVADASPTGLVLDARGSNFIPSMAPRIRELRAGVIYPDASHAVARRDRGQLVSLFTRDLETARTHPIVGERPIVLKGLRTYGDTRTEIVLGAEASKRLSELLRDGFLDDAGVVIVI